MLKRETGVEMLTRHVLALLLTGLCAVGCASSPERADYPRRLSAASGDSEEFDFFYATARALDGDYWGDSKQHASELETGVYRARVAADLHIGEHSHAAAWQENGELELLSVDAMPSEAWFSALQAAVEESPHDSLLVLVWGWKERFESTALKTAYTAAILDIGTPVLLFDWPSNQGDKPLGYKRSQDLATPSGQQLGGLLGEISERIGPEKTWIMGSSLACQVICDAFEWMAAQPEHADSDFEFDHVVLCAPDVSDREFEQRFQSEISALSRHLTVYVSSTDKALLMSSFINTGRRLGRRPPEAPPQLEEAMDLLELELQGETTVDLIDATPINRTRNYHHFFTDSPEFFDNLYGRLLNPVPQRSRRLYGVNFESDAGYWVLWGYEEE